MIEKLAKKKACKQLCKQPVSVLLKISICFFLIFFYSNSHAKTIHFIFQPIFNPVRTATAYEPLVKYLRDETGLDIQLVTSVNFPSYWETMKKGTEYDIIMDAAHFTEYRTKRLGYTVLAKIPDTVSFSLVTAEEELVLEPEELTSRRIASTGSPGLGGIRLAQMFPNPIRQPIIVETSNALAAIDKVRKGEADAAIIPTPLLNGLSGFNTVLTTEPVPHVGISAAPGVSKKDRRAIKKALIAASKTKEGQEMLKKINFPGFVSANEKTYRGQSALLDGVWGY